MDKVIEIKNKTEKSIKKSEKNINHDPSSDIAKNDKNPNVRRRAVGKISDENILVDIAKNAEDLIVRRYAVFNISDENILVDIVKNAEDLNVRIGAVSKISDVNVLDDIAKSTKDPIIHKYLKNKI